MQLNKQFKLGWTSGLEPKVQLDCKTKGVEGGPEKIAVPELANTKLTAKIHKGPLKMHSLAASENYVLRPITIAISQALNSILPDLDILMKKAFELAKMSCPHSWIAINYKKVVGLAQEINRRLNPQHSYAMTTYDFNQMYTNISTPDPITC